MIGRIMNDVKSIAIDFNTEVDHQGMKLEYINNDLETAQTNVVKAGEQIDEANERHKKSGKCLIWIAVIIVLCLIGLLAILFGTGII